MSKSKNLIKSWLEVNVRCLNGNHNIPSSDGDVGEGGYGIVMFAANPKILYPPAMCWAWRSMADEGILVLPCLDIM